MGIRLVNGKLFVRALIYYSYTRKPARARHFDFAHIYIGTQQQQQQQQNNSMGGKCIIHWRLPTYIIVDGKMAPMHDMHSQSVRAFHIYTRILVHNKRARFYNCSKNQIRYDEEFFMFVCLKYLYQSLFFK